MTVACPGMTQRAVSVDVPGGAGGPVTLELHVPAGAVLVPVCLFLPSSHGEAGCEAERAAIDDMLAKSSAAVAVVRYRPAPFLGALADVRAALDWLAEHAASYRADKNKIFVSGTGALAGALAAALCLADAADRPGRLKGMLLVSPCLAHPAVWAADDWAGGNARARARADVVAALGDAPPKQAGAPPHSPLRAPDADVRRLPPAAVFTAADDPLRPQAERWAARLRANDVEVALTVYESGGYQPTFEGAARERFLAADQAEGVATVLWFSVFYPMLE